MFKNFIKDPFFHFMLAALLIYGMYALLQPKQEMKEYVSTSKKEIETLKIKWEKEWNRPVREAELQSLIRKKEQDEVLFDEALAMKLYNDDSVIYERLLEKVKHLFYDANLHKKPDDKQLLDYYKNHIDNYRKDGRFSFFHIFISTDHDNPIQKANELLVLVRETKVKSEDIDQFGDTFKQHHIENATKQEISNTFGKGFYKQLIGLKKSIWSEPIISDFGVHLLFITDHSHGEVVPYNSVKDIVASDFIEDAKKKHYEKKLKSIYP